MSIGNQAAKVHRHAAAVFQRGTDWATFFRKMLGVDGVVRTAFPDPQSLSQFELTAEYAAIQQMLVQLRQKEDKLRPQEPTRVITIRLPQSMHEALQAEAHDHRTSMNKLCISKLLQMVDDELVPNKKKSGQRTEPSSNGAVLSDGTRA